MVFPCPDEPDSTNLRGLAELYLNQPRTQPHEQLSVCDMQRQLHELQVHQIELEMQNEELRRLHLQVETAATVYADFYDLSPVGYVSLDRFGDITQVNLTLARLLGVERSTLVGSRFGLFVAELDRLAFADFFEQAFAAQAHASCEMQLSTVSTQPCNVKMHATFSRDGREFRAVLVDITEQNRAHERLRETEARWLNVLHYAVEGVWDWDMATGKLVVSRKFTEMLGCTPDEFGSTIESWSDRVLPQDWPEVAHALSQHRDGHADSYESQYRLLCKDGGFKWILARGQIQQRDAAGVPLRMMGTCTDITLSKQQDELRLAHALSLRNTLVREVHHRIKNNLQGIMGLLRTVGHRYPHMQEPILQVVGQVQSVAVIHGLQGSSVHGQVRLCELTTAVAEGIAAHWQTTIEVAIAQPWLPCSIASQDTVPLALVLNELLQNAVKHREPPDSAVRVALQKTAEHGAVQISIVNSGQWPNGQVAGQAGAGVGLELVAALLPCHGAQLSHYTEGAQVHTVLLLSPPVLEVNGQIGLQRP